MEQELKFDVERGFALPEFGGRPLPRRTFTSTYVDTRRPAPAAGRHHAPAPGREPRRPLAPRAPVRRRPPRVGRARRARKATACVHRPARSVVARWSNARARRAAANPPRRGRRRPEGESGRGRRRCRHGRRRPIGMDRGPSRSRLRRRRRTGGDRQGTAEGRRGGARRRARSSTASSARRLHHRRTATRSDAFGLCSSSNTTRSSRTIPESGSARTSRRCTSCASRRGGPGAATRRPRAGRERLGRAPAHGSEVARRSARPRP